MLEELKTFQRDQSNPQSMKDVAVTKNNWVCVRMVDAWARSGLLNWLRGVDQ